MNLPDIETGMENFMSYDGYLEKYLIDADDELSQNIKTIIIRKARRRNTKHERNTIYKDKLFRRFLRCNPDGRDYQNKRGTHCPRADVVSDGEIYNFNPYTKVFIAPDGTHLRQYSGEVKLHGRHFYELCGHENRDGKKLANSRIRKEILTEESSLSYSYLIKTFGRWT